MKWSVFFFLLSFTNLIGWHQVGWSCVPRIYRSLHGLQFLERPFLGAGSIHHNNNKYFKTNSSSTVGYNDRAPQTHSPANVFVRIWTCLSIDTHLLKNKRLLIPHWVNGVGCGGPLGAIFLLGVSRQPNHLHLNSCFHVLVRQKLARIDLVKQVNKIWGHAFMKWLTVWMLMFCGTMFRTQWLLLELRFSLMRSLLNTRNHVSVSAGSLYY